MNASHQAALAELRKFDWLTGPLIRLVLLRGPFRRVWGALLNGVGWLLGKYLVFRGLV